MATNIQARIRETLNARSSSLVAVPEIQNESPEDAIHKLQIMIFQLSDELNRTHQIIDEMKRGRR